MSSDDPASALGEATPLLVTGCYRSGTTLLEKLLHAHPSATVASQPFPLLYIQVKAAFDRAFGIDRRYPLGHLFLEDGYREEDLHGFLDRFELSAADLDRLFADLETYTAGLWTPEILRYRGAIRPGTFLEVWRQLLGCVAELFPGPALRVVGAKEVLVEEYVPFLIGRGARALIIVRDPRDMIRSLHFGSRDNRTGLSRPILYSLRAWRKSVAIALSCDGRSGFGWMRYEDLVADTAGAMAGAARLLELDPYPSGAFEGGIRDQRGEPWGGNSSFTDKDGVSATSLGRFREELPPAVLRYIETVCLPEMRVTGYQPVAISGFDPDALASYREPPGRGFERIHPSFPADYSSEPARIRQEVERHQKLVSAGELSPQEARRWFLHRRAYERLREGGAAG